MNGKALGHTKRIVNYFPISFWFYPFIALLLFSNFLNASNVVLEKAIKQADSLKTIGNYKAATAVLEKVLAKSQSEDSIENAARIKFEIGNIHIYQGEYLIALQNLQESLNLYEQTNNNNGIASCYNSIASIHYSQNDYALAKENYKKCLEIRLTDNYSKDLGIVYMNMGLVSSKLGQIEEALDYHTKSLSIWDSIKSYSGRGVTLSHISGCLKLQGKFDEALRMALQSVQILKSNNSDSRTLNFAQLEVGLLKTDLGLYQEALNICEPIYKEVLLLNMPQNRYKSCECLYLANSGLGNYEAAFKYFQEYVLLQDSLFGKSISRDVTRLELNYLFNKIHVADSLRHLSENNLNKRQINEQRYGLFIAAGILLLLAALAFSIFKGKAKTEALLLNILPDEIAKELKREGKSKARQYENVTVLFTDFVSFTSISEQLSPTQLVEEIHRNFTAFDAIIEKHGLEKIKTIGDAYLAVCGLPVLKPDHAKRVILAAKEITKFVEADKGLFEIRVGVNSGPVVAGIVGVKKYAYDIWGDTVNTAARMEQNSLPNRVNVSGTTYELLKDIFRFEYRGKIHAKNKGEVDMYFLID